MHIRLAPDQNLCVEKKRIGRVPTLILRPVQQSPGKPGVLWIHGGGYIVGMKEMVYMSRAADLVKQFGVTVLSPGYRLAWLSPYPAALEDCFAVLQYMDENREGLGIRSVMVGGESAGGGLAAAICMMARDKGIQIDFQMPLYPMISNHDTESSRNNHGRVWNTRRNHFGWRMYLRESARKPVPPYAAPSCQTDYGNLPPCYTFVGEGEPFYTETVQYVEHLRAAGVQADVDVYPTDMHAFDMLEPEEPVSREAARRFLMHFEMAMREAEAGAGIRNDAGS